MTKAEKLFIAMKANPAADWQIDDVEAVCRQFGLVVTPARGGGSHYKVRKPGKNVILTIPARRPILPVYIRALVSMIEEPSP
jgi:hypothetical protein